MSSYHQKERAVTQLTGVQFVEEVSGQSHAMAGAVIALSASQAVALGQACVHITQQEGAGSSEPVAVLANIKSALLNLCDQDATAIATYAALRDAGQTLAGQQLLCHAPAEVCRLSLQAAWLLQDFRPSVTARVRDDLEMAITLLAGTAQAAMLLLDSNLRIWPETDLLAQFEPIREQLASDIVALSPVKRIRTA